MASSAVAHLPLSSGGYCLVDADVLNWHCEFISKDGGTVHINIGSSKWHRKKRSTRPARRLASERGYRYVFITRVISGKPCTIWLHRLLFAHIHGIPDGMQIDHRNGCLLDNRLNNLRLATCSQNAWNRRKSWRVQTTSRFKGVRLDNGRWRAEIRHRGVQKHIGTFGTEEAAACAYDSEARRLFGEFAKTNFPANVIAIDDKQRKKPDRGLSRPARRARRMLMARSISLGASIRDTAKAFNVVDEVVRGAVKEFRV